MSSSSEGIVSKGPPNEGSLLLRSISVLGKAGESKTHMYRDRETTSTRRYRHIQTPSISERLHTNLITLPSVCSELQHISIIISHRT